MTTTRATRWAFAALALLATAASAGAQVNDGWQMGTVEPETPWFAIAYAVLGTALIAMGAFKNAKRTHQD